MRCLNPSSVGFRADGKTISWSPRYRSKEYATFAIPCGKCLECKLDYARQWAVRCVHEAQMHSNNSFITLTYSDENLKSPKLQYEDFQKFMRKLRKTQNEPIGVFVTGEYGEKTKRPHWHAILFNYRPKDCIPKYKNQRGDQVWSSENLDKLWGKGISDIGSVTMESAGYCARYAAKKLGHSDEFNREFRPISKKSSKHAIGKKWLESFWPDIFNHGYVILIDGTKVAAPRYYEKWLQKNHPERWQQYVTETKQRRIASASSKAESARLEESIINEERRNRLGVDYVPTTTRNFARKKIQNQKFEQLQKSNKI